MAITSVQEVFQKIPEVFNADSAKGLNKVFQFDIKGENGGQWFVAVQDGSCDVQEGTHDEPSVTLTMSDSDWLDLVNKDLNGMQAFMTGKLKVSGDIMLAQRIYDLFPF
jgi:putative sterol carrier protein